ncbi:hypothetical protein ACFZBU_44765 [Embleya sp. NPDC008237]|uniref:hypothetical protein n=1 Tax=Embleya sp. NPDC008237 TaxID=3363978 RepID=UPI0036E8D7D7
MRVLIVEDDPRMAEAICDGLRPEAIAADIAVDGGTAPELPSIDTYDVAVLDRDVPGAGVEEVADAVHVTVSALRRHLGEPWMSATVPGVDHRIDTAPRTGRAERGRG